MSDDTQLTSGSYFTHTWPPNVFLTLPKFMYKKCYRDMYLAWLEEFFSVTKFQWVAGGFIANITKGKDVLLKVNAN